MGFAQTEYSSGFRKIGVGIGYNSNSVIGDSIRPLELSLRYRINDKHTFRVYTPIRLKRYKQQGIEVSYVEAPFKDSKSTQHLFGVGLMYDYAIHLKNDLYWIIGIGGDYQMMQSDNFRNYPINNMDQILNRIEEWKIDYDTYNFYPLVGVRYAYNRFGIEAYYKLQCSMLKIKESGFYNDYDLDTNERWRSGSYDVPLRSNLLNQLTINIVLFYLF